MKNVNMKDVFERAIKTFIQAALSYLITALAGANFFDGNKTQTFWIGLGISALAAGLSAMWNGVIEPLIGNYKEPETNGKELETNTEEK